MSLGSREVGTLKMLEDGKSKLVFDWTIPNWMENRETEIGKFLISPMFTTTQPKSERVNSWHIRLCPRGGGEGVKDWLSIYLKHEEMDGMAHPVKVRRYYSIVKENGEISDRMGMSDMFFETVSCGHHNFVMGEEVVKPENSYLKDGALTIRLEIEVKDAE